MLIFAGFVTGILVGLTGVGGGSLMTPLLLLFFGVAPVTAVGTDLCFAALTKSGAMRLHHVAGLIDWEVLRRMWLGSLPAAVLVIVAIRAGALGMDASVLKVALAIALLATSIGLLLQERLHAFGRSMRLAQVQGFMQLQAPLTVLAGVLLGFVVAFTSVGAGAIGAVLLACLYPLRLTPSRLIATDIAHATPLAFVAGAGHVLVGHVDFVLLAWLLCGSIPGVLIGAMLSARLPPKTLRIALAIVLGLVGMKVLASLGIA